MLTAIQIGVVAVSMLLRSDSETELRTHYEAARAAQRAGELAKAVEEYRAVVRLAPQMAEAHVNLGLLCHALGALEESARELETADKIRPGLAGVHLYLGIDYARLNQSVRAIPLLRKAVEAEPARKEARSWLASALWASGRQQEALIELERAAVAFPGDVDMLFLLGEGYRKAAAAIIDGIVGAQPGSPLVHQILAETYAAQGNWDRSRRHCERLLQKVPADFGAGLGLAAALVAQGNRAEAELAYARVAAAPPSPAREHVASAVAALHSEQAIVAHSEVQLYIDELPAQSAAANGSAWRLFGAHDYLGAAAELRRTTTRSGMENYLLARCYERLAVRTLDLMVQSAPDSYRVHQLRAQIAESRADSTQALEEYEIVVTLQPSLAGVHFAIGRLLWNDGRIDEARKELQRELAINPNHAEANAEIGTIYVREHDAPQGVPYLERAIKLQPDLLEAHKQLGKGYSMAGRKLDAERQLKLALAGDRNGSVYYMLGNVYKAQGRTADAAKALETARRIKAARLAEVMITDKEAAAE